MLHISKNLLFETARYCPEILLTLLAVNKDMMGKITGDISYMQHLVEDLYTKAPARQLTWSECVHYLGKVKYLVTIDRNTIRKYKPETNTY